MTSKRLALVVASAMAVTACGGVARPESRAIQPEPTVAESPTTSFGVGHTSTTDVSPSPTTVAETAPAVMDAAESTPSTTLAADGPSPTTTNPAESIDLAGVREALDALDTLFGDLDSHIGSVDLDEGETP